jgi:hypothetical protein
LISAEALQYEAAQHRSVGIRLSAKDALIAFCGVNENANELFFKTTFSVVAAFIGSHDRRL